MLFRSLNKQQNLPAVVVLFLGDFLRDLVSTVLAALHVCVHPSLLPLLVFLLSVHPEDKIRLISALVGTKTF